MQHAEKNVGEAERKIWKADKDAFREERVFFQPSVGKNNQQNAPGGVPGPAALQHYQPAIAQ